MRTIPVVGLFSLLCACSATPDAPSSPDPGGVAGGVSTSGGAAGTGFGGMSGAGFSAGAAGTPAQGGAGAASTGGTGAGAGAGAGGSGGGQEVPAHVVGECDGLGAVDQFEDITPPNALGNDYGVVSLVLDPVHSGTLYAGTDRRGMFKSTDCGASWEKVNTGRSADVIDGGLLWSLAIDPIEPDVLYVGSAYSSDSSLFKTTNGGKDWDSLFPLGSNVAETVEYSFFQDIALDPDNHQHLLVTFHATCKGEYGPGCMAESEDAGETWRLFKTPGDTWVEGAGPFILSGSHFLFATTQNGIYATEDAGGTWTQIGPGSSRFLYPSPTGTTFLESDYGLLHSTDPGSSWSLVDGAPKGTGVVGDGTRLFASDPNAGENPALWEATESNPSDWALYPAPPPGRAPYALRYDEDHHLLFADDLNGGVFRMVTQ